jgi:3'-5' exonuclease
MQKLWNKKADKISHSDDEKLSHDELYDNRAGIFAEFGKIICICVGYVARNSENISEFRQKSFAGDDERRILMDFFELLHTHFSKPDQKLC